VGSP
jgi:hypothetical protein